MAPTSPDFGNLKKLDDIQLELKILGNDLAESGPFKVSGKLTGSAKALALSEAQGTISQESIKRSLRLGRAGYTQIMSAMRDIATGLSAGIAKLGPFERVSDGSAIPVFAFKLKDHVNAN